MIRLGRYQNLSFNMVQKGLSRFDEGFVIVPFNIFRIESAVGIA